jgi:hypothetical protein
MKQGELPAKTSISNPPICRPTLLLGISVHAIVLLAIAIRPLNSTESLPWVTKQYSEISTSLASAFATFSSTWLVDFFLNYSFVIAIASSFSILYWNLLFFFSIEKSHVRSHYLTWLDLLRIPLAASHLLMSIGFLAFVILASQPSVFSASNAMYELIIGMLGYILMSGFVSYGKFKALQGSGQSRTIMQNSFGKISTLLITCGLTVTIQLVLVSIYAFSTVSHLFGLGIYYFALELMPSYMILWIILSPAEEKLK